MSELINGQAELVGTFAPGSDEWHADRKSVV